MKFSKQLQSRVHQIKPLKLKNINVPGAYFTNWYFSQKLLQFLIYNSKRVKSNEFLTPKQNLNVNLYLVTVDDDFFLSRTFSSGFQPDFDVGSVPNDFDFVLFENQHRFVIQLRFADLIVKSFNYQLFENLLSITIKMARFELNTNKPNSLNVV